MNATLDIGSTVGDFYVEYYIKTSSDSESYIVTDSERNRALMKLYTEKAWDNLPSCNLSHHSFAKTIESDSITIDGKAYHYIIRDYVDGNRISDLIDEGEIYDWDEASEIIMKVLSAVDYLHGQTPKMFHNDITARNVLVYEEDGKTKICLIGLGHISQRVMGKAPFCTTDLNNWYRAPETFKGIYNERSDIFSIGVLLFKMLTGCEPWSPDILNSDPRVDPEVLKSLRKLATNLTDNIGLNDEQKHILEKMLELDYDKRYQFVREVCVDFMAERVNAESNGNQHHSSAKKISKKQNRLSDCECEEVGKKKKTVKRSKGQGFADVAGMEDVKKMLFKEVMFVMQNPDKAEKYRLKTPNGVLFYGPPGCGKTFIAQKFAEESKVNFKMVKASDLGSIYIHGTQGKIAELFEEAEEFAPTVICFDELDGMVPDRSTIHSENASGEVNEFLSQLNNCAERGIFVIGTTNRPEKIDPAILRTGRLDKAIYISLPDYEARKQLFKIHLEGRFNEDSIDIDQLARQTEGYVASDISYIVNEAAIESAMADVPISQACLLDEISRTSPSVTQDDAEDYARMRAKFEQRSVGNQRRKVGFMQN